MNAIIKTLKTYGLHLLLFFLCFGAYVSNMSFLAGGDQQGNMLLAVNLLKRQSFSFEPRDTPEHFVWGVRQPGEEPQRVNMREWNQEVDALYKQGRLLHKRVYILSDTVWPNTYVNSYGIGTASTILPFYAVLDLFVDITSDRFWLWHGAAIIAALLSALSAVLIFAIAASFAASKAAFLIAVVFALGTCVWPISSQAMWQHTASIFYLCLGIYFLLKIPRRPIFAAWCGAALGMAVLCRPTNIVVVACVGIYLLWMHRPAVIAYALGGLPFAVVLAVYNAYYFGSPLSSGQTLTSMEVAMAATGSDVLWHGRWWESLPALFFSPQRGLLWYSPVLFFGFYGGLLAWKNPTYRPLIPIQVSVLILILVAASWFDWSGGLTWGYRLILEVAVLMTLVMIPAIERILADRKLRSLFAVLLAWSIGVQFIGAYTYNGYNEQLEYREQGINTRDALWWWHKPQILHHLVNFRSERRMKQLVADNYTGAKPMRFLYVHPPEDDLIQLEGR